MLSVVVSIVAVSDVAVSAVASSGVDVFLLQPENKAMIIVTAMSAALTIEIIITFFLFFIMPSPFYKLKCIPLSNLLYCDI